MHHHQRVGHDHGVAGTTVLLMYVVQRQMTVLTIEARIELTPHPLTVGSLQLDQVELHKASLKALVCRRNIFLNQVVTTGAYPYLLWSFVTSFFAYTSYIATFVVASALFHLLQKETQA